MAVIDEKIVDRQKIEYFSIFIPKISEELTSILAASIPALNIDEFDIHKL
jgi:hypothetical protein